MNTNEKNTSCQIGCWALAAGIGLVVFVGILVFGDMGWLGAIFLSGLAFGVSGALLSLFVCKPLPPLGSVTVGGDAVSAPSSSAASSSQSAAAPASGSTSSEAEASPLKPSTHLAGEAELAARKGTWKYESGAPDASSPSKAATDAQDVVGTQPESLEGPRGGVADDLKRIKGVGPKLEKLCNSMGFYHFEQIANWTASDVAWVDENLEGFKGRVSRDEWVKQAKTLAAE